MKSFWICALLLITSTYAYDLGDYEDYDFGALEESEELPNVDEKNNEKTDLDNDLKVEEEIQEFRKADHDNLDTIDEPKDTIDSKDDYQIEDNRDKSQENFDDAGGEAYNNDNLKSINNLEQPAVREEDNDAENRPEVHHRNADYALLWGDDNIAPLPVPDDSENEENNAILEETRKILEEADADQFEDIKKTDIGYQDVNEQKDNEEEILEYSEENQEENDHDEAINLNDDTDASNIERKGDDIHKELIETKNEESKESYADLNAELDELFKSFDNFPEENDDEQEIIKKSEENIEESNNDQADNQFDGADGSSVENKQIDIEQGVIGNENKDIEEDTIAKAYADLNADLDKLLGTFDKLRDDESKGDHKIEDIEKGLKDIDDLFDDYDINNFDEYDELVKDDSSELEKLLNDEDDMKEENMAAEDLELNNDELNKPNPDDTFEKDAETFDSELKLIVFGDDALVDTEQKDNETDKNDENIDDHYAEKNEETNVKSDELALENDDETAEEKEVKTALVDELTSAELDDLVSQFSILHNEVLDVNADSFNKNIAPVHITLKLDEPTIITSPDYPNPYPTNNIVDWIISGEGMGIELNITEFAVNGALGDYLLIKPGGVDETGHQGLLFTYRLTTERRYRFTDVDRLFMRFESKLGMMFFRGFVISAKMIAPIPDEPEPVPEPEAVIVPPHSTSTLFLAITMHQFEEVKDEFKELLADMAEEYIRDNDVDPGLNSTLDVTQITSVRLCPMSWPNFEGCTAVTFGVSLAYDEGDPRLNEQDLGDMWREYADKEPYVSRLNRMGISEFIRPDSAAMTAWLVIAGGVVISMAMLAFVLWRYSCFEDYTRMKAYSDTDSLHNEKRNLDLYPTPHQTLPPLYSENEYKWPEDDSTRVDMGGFANKSYATDNMYDFESDEDVIPTRDRNGAINAKDVYNV